MSAARALHRLIDIVVEEVSLVDRAANKHRFLIVKRDEGEAVDDGMEDLTQDAGGEESEGTSGEGANDGSTLAVAAKALTSLTEVVEKLAAGDAPPDAMTQAVSELTAVATELAKTVGVPSPAAPTAGEDPLKGVHAVLEQVRAMLSTGAPPAPVETAKNDAPLPGGTDKLDALLAQVGTLAKGLTEQGAQFGQRMAQLEKHFGLPNSTPVGERPRVREGEEDEAFWSLDLNRPSDRESVDKSVSFHDL